MESSDDIPVETWREGSGVESERMPEEVRRVLVPIFKKKSEV